jgi:hypothetical protein
MMSRDTIHANGQYPGEQQHREAGMADARTGPAGQAVVASPDGCDDAALIRRSVHTPDRFAGLFDRRCSVISTVSSTGRAGQRARG